jgi:hypothetical protein
MSLQPAPKSLQHHVATATWLMTETRAAVS